MLENHIQSNSQLLIDRLECNVELPETWRADYFRMSGAMPTDLNDRRRFVRRALRTKAVMKIEQTLPAFPRETEYYAVYTFDISRQGIAFLHTGELMPGERCVLILPTQCVKLIVMRCRYYNPRCYLIGTRFDDGE